MRTKAKGDRMRITTTGGVGPTTAATTSSETRVAAAPSAGPASQATALESETLKPAQAALAEMPEVDQAKVDALRDALAEGRIRFDPDRLAQLIVRYHGGRS